MKKRNRFMDLVEANKQRSERRQMERSRNRRTAMVVVAALGLVYAKTRPKTTIEIRETTTTD